MLLRTLTATRYVTPLREGGSLPAIIEADDDGLYVLKFRGAGQGPKALIAELVAGEIGRALGLPVPEIVFVELDPALGRNEPDFEIQALIKASVGLNLALDYLPGSLSFDPLSKTTVDPLLASSIVWFDAYTTNVDRTPRNTNILLWHKNLWLIDHGAALYFHHNWADYLSSPTDNATAQLAPLSQSEGKHLTQSRSPFKQIKQHVLLPFASALPEADAMLRSRLSTSLIEDIVNLIPDDWLANESIFANPIEHRAAYTSYLLNRLASADIFVEEALHARSQLV